MAFTLGATPAEVLENNAAQAPLASTPYTAGRQLIALMVWNHATITLTNVKYDPGGADERTFTLVGTMLSKTLSGPTDARLHMAYLSNVPATKSAVVTATWSGNLAGAALLRVFEIIGGDTTDCLDNSAQTTGTSGAPSVSLTTNTANCAVFAINANDGTDASAQATYTTITMANPAYYNQGEYNLDVGAAAGQTVNMTGPNAGWGIKAAAFKLAGGAGPTPLTFTGSDSLAGGELL